ncbi:MAG: hypothetical protein JSV27_11950 [Candidatus Bathyarchaeota archaeon]|nr:MAG: hypothetical protein JSV27_11950 [Candidatus Bathyarchaeota archaeon]
MQEEFINCGKCGRAVPKTYYCIYCGAQLSGSNIRRGPIVDGKKRISRVPQPNLFELSTRSRVTVERGEPSSRRDDELEPKLAHRIRELIKYQIWRVKLVGILVEGGVSAETFTKLYDEYTVEIDRHEEERQNKISIYRKEHQELMDELESTEKGYEELKTRTAVGQMSDKELLTRAPGIQEKINNLTMETKNVEVKLSRLTNVLEGVTPEERYNLERDAMTDLESLDPLVTRGKVSVEMRQRMEEDLRSILKYFDDSVGDGEEKDELLNDLDTLEVRFKVGEITRDEYESLKKDVQGRLGRSRVRV